MKPRIGISLGDPGSIAPEVLLKALKRPIPRAQYIVFGSLRVLSHHSTVLGIPLPPKIKIVDIDNVSRPYFGPRPASSGKASMEYLVRAFHAYRNGEIDAIITGPIHKEAWHACGFRYPGQTEFCAEQTGTKDHCMLMVGSRLRIALLSTHYSLQHAILQVRKKNIVQKLRLLHRELLSVGFKNPRIACSALNPHAGEGGAFGMEEKKEIQPALETVRSDGIFVEGPIAPESIFRMAVSLKKWDVVLALYHDQAMIPLKLVNFERSANVTLGLPLIRTSPDHGTAFDIAGRGIASPESMRFACRIAVDWTRRKMQHIRN